MTVDSESAFSRLQRVNWLACGEGTFHPNLEQLFFDYIATARNICRHLGSNADLYNKLSGLFDFVPRHYSEIHPLPESVTMWIEQQLTRDYGWRSRGYVASAAYGFVLWNELTASEQIHLCGATGTANPYSKLIEFFEAGGAFSCEHNMFDRIYPLSPNDPWHDQDNIIARPFPKA